MFKKSLILIFTVIISLITVGCNDEEAIAKKEIIQHNWNESPLFKSGSYTMIGEEGRLGFIYDDDEVVKFYPNKNQKYMWHFWGDEDELIGDFKVLGTHENSDEEIIIVPETDNSFLSPNNGADQHYPTNMMLPKSGMWKLDAYIGDSLFGSVYVKVHNESPLFESDSITMIGEEGRLGFIYDDNEGLRFYPNKTQKYMWHFWGNEDELIGDFKVLGTHENSDEEIIIVPKINNSILSPNNGADQHHPTNMMLPKSGMWKLDAYIGDSLFGSVYVKVHKK